MEFKRDYFEMTEEIPSMSEEIKNVVVAYTSTHKCDKITQMLLDNINAKMNEVQELCDELFKYGRMNVEHKKKCLETPILEEN